MIKAKSYVKRSTIKCPSELAYKWHINQFSFERLVPPWESVNLLDWERPIRDGSQAHFEIKLGPLTLSWLATHHGVVPGKTFSDKQTKGPFQYWNHKHSFIEGEENSFILEDKIEYRVPVGPLGSIVTDGAIESKIRRGFNYRHETTKRDLELLVNNSNLEKKNILIAGATGLVGRQLVAFLSLQGHSVSQLHRAGSSKIRHVPQLSWDPSNPSNNGSGLLNNKSLENFDVIINLAGENIASGTWSDAKKEKIRSSRVNSTQVLVDAINKLENPPELFINASAVGIYGNRGILELDEDSQPGAGFLSDVCMEWEDEAVKVAHEKTRVVLLRLGVVLTPMGGMLKKLIGPFSKGAGGKIGSGDQYFSWIAMDDVLEGIEFVINNQSLSGPVNLTAPKPTTNSEFTEILGKTINRPTVLPIPEPAVKAIFGEMGTETMLTSTRVIPEKLMLKGYNFRYPTLDRALKHLLGY